jgi:hypothetical protein
MDIIANVTSIISRMGFQNKATSWILDNIRGMSKGGKREMNLLGKALPAIEKMSPKELETFNFGTLYNLFPEEYQEFMDNVFY